MCKGIKYLSSLFSDPLSSHLQLPKRRHLPCQRRVWRERHRRQPFRSAKSQFLRHIFLQIPFRYITVKNLTICWKILVFKLKSSITFDRKALQPCKGHFWTDGIGKIFWKYIWHCHFRWNTWTTFVYFPKYKLPIEI